MKKVFAFVLAALMTASLAACGSNNSSSSVGSSDPTSSAVSSENHSSTVGTGTGMKDGKTMEDFIAAMDEAFSEVNASAIDDAMLTDLYTVKAEDVEAYKGNMSMINVLAYDVLVVKAKEGKVENVKAALEKRKENRISEFEFYPVNGNDENTKNALVLTSGDYGILVICDDYEKAQAVIDAHFDL